MGSIIQNAPRPELEERIKNYKSGDIVTVDGDEYEITNVYEDGYEGRMVNNNNFIRMCKVFINYAEIKEE